MIAANDNAPVASDIRFRVEPRLVPPAKAARRLHLTPGSFTDKLPALEARGFPLPCPVIGHYDLLAIDRWIDSLSEVPAVLPVDDFETRLSRLG